MPAILYWYKSTNTDAGAAGADGGGGVCARNGEPAALACGVDSGACCCHAAQPLAQ